MALETPTRESFLLTEKVHTKMTKLYFDIETIGTQDQTHLDFITANVRDPEKAIEKSALNGTRGELYCVSWAFDDRPVMNANRGQYDPELKTFERTERELIDQLSSDMFSIVARTRPTWVAHNIEFDLRFLWQRLALNSSRDKRHMPIEAKPWGDEIFDTMKKWSGFRGYTTLHEMATVLKLDITDPIKGSDVWKCLVEGRHELVINHCDSDVELLRDIYKRIWG